MRACVSLRVMTDGTYLVLVGMGDGGWRGIDGEEGAVDAVGCRGIMFATGAEEQSNQDGLQIGFETLDAASLRDSIMKSTGS
jgi:hypothetical protein